MLKVTEKGIGCRSPEALPEGYADCFEANVQVAARNLLGNFRVPCVLTSSGWVRRSLLLEELGAAMDLPPAMLPRFSVSAKNDPTIKERLIALPALKMIQAAGAILAQGNQLQSPIAVFIPETESGTERVSLSTFIPLSSMRRVDASHAKATREAMTPLRIMICGISVR